MEQESIINLQGGARIDAGAIRLYVKRLSAALELGKRHFNVCFVDDRAIRRLNLEFRGKNRATDVLSFPWNAPGEGEKPGADGAKGRGFLGEIIISAETARRNARAEGHPFSDEMRWLILHGALHLLGYDHEQDHGEMTKLELNLRDVLDSGVASARGIARRAPRTRAKRP